MSPRTIGPLDEDRIARALLSAAGEPGDTRITERVHEAGAAAALAEFRSPRSGVGADLAARLRGLEAGPLLERAAQRGIRFVTPADDEWPAALDDLAHAGALHERGGVPVGLWLRGPLRLDEAVARAVSVVGARASTGYGEQVAGSIAAGVAEAGWTVVSGAAFGIDQSAHRGALAVRGTTVAVLACGVDRAYPATHQRMLDYIAEVGLVVSESAPGTAPLRIRFLARNRLIAAMSAGTVVVEAAIRSGALNTASWADGLSRVLMGVPGPVTSAASAGVHQMIRHRGALLVTDGRDVLEAVGGAGEHTVAVAREEETARDRLTALERQVLDAVPVRNAARAESIARAAGIAPAAAADALRTLVAAGLAEQAADGYRLSEHA